MVALVAAGAGLPISEQNIRVKTHDIGGGFGGKVPVYPGYVLAVAASFLIGKPVKWIEDRSENLQADSFARDYHMHAEMGATKDGKITSLKAKTIADHGYTDAAADPSKYPAGLFNVITGSYDFPNAFVEVDGVYTNKPPGGVAYRCSFRVTEAVHAVERMVDILAHQIGKDPAQLRMENFIQPEQFPYKTPTGWSYDSGNYPAALQKAMDMIDYAGLRKEQAEKRARGELMGIGISSFTEIVGAGPSHDFDILGIKMFDSCEIRVHPTGKVIARLGVQSQGQGHETTFAQIIAEELGFPVADIKIEEGDTDTAPYGLGTYASRSTPVAGAATAMAARKIQDKARKIAAHLLEANEDDLEWEPGKFSVKGSPDRSKTIQEIAFAAYTNHPDGMEAGLEAVDYYDPPNLTFPFGSYICVVDIDKGTGQVHVRRFVAIDDCGNIINPMIVDGQIHGGLTMGLAPALYEQITYDELGNNLAGTFMDYLLPTAVESPGLGDRQDDHPVAASPDRRQGRGGVGHGRRAAGDRQRGRRCAVAPGRAQHRHPDHAPEGLGDPPREGHLLTRGPARCHRRRGGEPCHRSRGPPSSRRRAGRSRSPRSWRSSGRPRRARARRGIVHPDGTIEGWVGGSCAQPVVVREALRSHRRRPAPAAPAVEGRSGRGPPRRRRHRAGHDLPFRRDPGDLRGTASARAAPVGRRHDARSPARSSRSARPRAGG